MESPNPKIVSQTNISEVLVRDLKINFVFISNMLFSLSIFTNTHGMII